MKSTPISTPSIHPARGFSSSSIPGRPVSSGFSMPTSEIKCPSISCCTRLETVVLFSPVIAARAAREIGAWSCRALRMNREVNLADQRLISGACSCHLLARPLKSRKLEEDLVCCINKLIAYYHRSGLGVNRGGAANSAIIHSSTLYNFIGREQPKSAVACLITVE